MNDRAPPGASLDVTSLRDRYLAAQLAGDRRQALRLLVDEGLSRGLTVADLQRLVQEAQREIGRLWQENRITIAQEHMATAISQLALAHLYQHARPLPPNDKRIIVACVEGELHDFPARLAADALDLAGFHVRYLGANVPTTSLVALLREEPPDLLALSVTMSFNVPSLREAVTRVRAEVRPDLPIAVGGHACTWAASLAAEVGAVATGCEAAELVESVRRALGVAPR